MKVNFACTLRQCIQQNEPNHFFWLFNGNIIFDKQGVPREFGIGYKKKTVLPIWLVVIILAIISYFIILYYLNYRKIMF